MGRTPSQGLRDRVIAAVDGGLSRHAAAERFGVAVATAIRWVRAWRADGLPTPRPKGGDLRSQRIEKYRDVILAAIDAQVDITLVELSKLLRKQHGASFAPSTIWRFLDRHGMTFKKNSARPRAGAARRRRAQASLARRPAGPRSGASGLRRCLSCEGDQGSFHDDGAPPRPRLA